MPSTLSAAPMRVLYAIGAPEPLGRAVCALSTFDGVHRGHRALAERTAARAAQEGAVAVAVVVWEGERSQDARGEQADGARGHALLSLLDERLALLGALGLFGAALVVSRAPDAPALDAETLLSALASRLEVVAVLADEPGDVDDWGDRLARSAAEAAGRRVRPDHDQVRVGEREPEHDGERGRSSIGGRVTGALLAGDMEAARELLGHPYGIEGEVVGGDRRGRVLGYPTANLRLDPRKLLPADGVYAVRARLPGESQALHPAVASLGVRPQFGEYGPRLLEVYLLDAALDLYGLRLGVEFVERLREQRRFADVEALKAQMARDVEVARDVLNREIR